MIKRILIFLLVLIMVAPITVCSAPASEPPDEPPTYEEKIWEYLTEGMGYSKQIAAAIMGNISAECSFRPYIYVTNSKSGHTYYGLFMWDLEYCPEISGNDWPEQLHMMAEWLDYQFDTYPTDMTAEEFLKMTNVKQAALIFAKVFERCGSGSYAVRQTEAERIYKKYGK